jgi:plasmid stabilization system protein ParE
MGIAQDNPRAVEDPRTAVRRAARTLGEHPECGQQRIDLAPENVRFLALKHWPYILVYRANSTPPRRLRAPQGARNLPDVLPHPKAD